MRIGIDIDDTLTDIKEELIEAGENKNDIYYDKLVVNARDKKQACIEEKIDLYNYIQTIK